MSSYSSKLTLDLPFDEAIELLTAALKTEGFGILTSIDMKAVLKQKLDIEFQRYTILGACNPLLAHKALQIEQEVGLLLPCHIVVYENSADVTTISIADPLVILDVADNRQLAPLAAEVAARLRRVADTLNNLNNNQTKTSKLFSEEK